MRLRYLLVSIAICMMVFPALAQELSKKQKKELEQSLKLAETGDCNAIINAAHLLGSRKEGFVMRISEEAVAVLQKGYELNCPEAISEFAYSIIINGIGDRFDSVINVYARAAALGYAEADYRMGMLYLYEFGDFSFKSGTAPESNTKPHYNPALAGQCFKRAADKGYAPAVEQLEIVKAIADRPMEKALEAYNAGDYVKAHLYFSYAAIDKDATAMMYLGHMHLYGQGCKADNFDPTQTYYRQAGYNGLLDGFFISGQLSERYGTNRGWAKSYYQMGADKGDQACKDAVARLNALTAAEYENWKERLGYTIKSDAVQLSQKVATTAKTCTMCHGSGKIVSPIQQELYQDKSGRWYKILNTQYETCWACKGSGKL